MLFVKVWNTRALFFLRSEWTDGDGEFRAICSYALGHFNFLLGGK